MKFRGPLVNSYWSAVLLVICALIPFLALSSALNPLLPILGKDVHLSTQALSLSLGMSNAAYALGRWSRFNWRCTIHSGGCS